MGYTVPDWNPLPSVRSDQEMAIGAEIEELLPASHVQALYDSIEVLTDQFYEDVASLEYGTQFHNTWMAMYLPDKHLPRYGVLFAKKLLTCLITVGWKLRAPEGYLLSCVAEELALNALIEHAEFIFEEQGIEADFGPLCDYAFEDTEFEVLFDLAKDGIEDSDVGRYLGMGHLHFDEWFKPFVGAYVHPYVADGE